MYQEFLHELLPESLKDPTLIWGPAVIHFGLVGVSYEVMLKSSALAGEKSRTSQVQLQAMSRKFGVIRQNLKARGELIVEYREHKL